MPAPEDQYNLLFSRLLKGELSPQETDDLIEWLGSEDADPVAVEHVLGQLQQPVAFSQITPEITAALEARLPLIFQHQPQTIVQRPAKHFSRSFWLRCAAAVALLFSIAAYFLFTGKTVQITTSKKLAAVTTPDIAPGKNGAVLTLDDGSTVVLDSLGNGVVANQNGTKVLLKNGQLIYNADGTAQPLLAYNTMTTPRGRQFQLVLPDETKVWLNAASSIRYPTAFTGNERKVEITGEVYFEVAHNAKMPFKVKVNDETEIQVLGTHFNVNSYKDEESINTTLLEGSVQISSKGQKALLTPGQLAQVDAISQQPIKIVKGVDVDKIMAWKNGLFNFQDASLKEVLSQLKRWYDIEVVYEKDVPKIEFMGKLRRDLSLSEVLRGLQVSEVHFRIEDGRRLVVMP